MVAGSSLLASPVLQAQELEWATSAGGIGSDGGDAIATDQRRNSSVTGSFRGTATFGAGEANETVLSSGGESSDIFVSINLEGAHK